MRAGIIPDRTRTSLITVAGTLAVGAIAASLVGGGTSAPGAAPEALPASLPLTTSAISGAELRARAAGQLVVMLQVVGWATLAVGLVLVLSLWADLAARVKMEVAIHRAVGASRQVLVRVALGVGSRIAVATCLLGLGLGTVAGQVAGQPWTREWNHAAVLSAIVIGVVGLSVLVGAIFPLWAARTRRTVAIDEEPAPLGLASTQLGLSLALLVAGAAVIDRTRTVTDQAVPAGILSGYLISTVASTDGSTLDVAGLVGRAHAAGQVVSVGLDGDHLGHGPVDELITDCGQCSVGGIFQRYRPLRAAVHLATADTFRARGLVVIEGRDFADADKPGSEPVAVVNVYLARRYFEGGKPIGRTVFPAGNMGGPRYRVIGVVDDRRPIGLGGSERPREAIYLSAAQHPGTTAELLTDGDPTPLLGPGVRTVESGSVGQALERALGPTTWFGRWFVVMAGVALGLATGGTAVMLWLWVRSLSTELAIRRAVGARRIDLVLIIIGGAWRTGLTGVAVALTVFGPMLWPNLDLVAPGTDWWQPGALGVGAAALVAAALIGALAPVRRILRATPNELGIS